MATTRRSLEFTVASSGSSTSPVIEPASFVLSSRDVPAPIQGELDQLVRELDEFYQPEPRTSDASSKWTLNQPPWSRPEILNVRSSATVVVFTNSVMLPFIWYTETV